MFIGSLEGSLYFFALKGTGKVIRIHQVNSPSYRDLVVVLKTDAFKNFTIISQNHLWCNLFYNNYRPAHSSCSKKGFYHSGLLGNIGRFP